MSSALAERCWVFLVIRISEELKLNFTINFSLLGLLVHRESLAWGHGNCPENLDSDKNFRVFYLYNKILMTRFNLV